MSPARDRPGATRPRSLWVPALLSSLMLIIVITGVAAGHFYWTEVRTSMAQMDRGLATARQRQKDMVQKMSAAQTRLLAQQRHIEETEERLRSQEIALAAQREDLEQERKRLRLAAAARQAKEEDDRIRKLVRRLDLAMAGLSDPGGLREADEAVSAIADWAARSESDAGLARATSARVQEAMAALTAAESTSIDRLSKRLRRLGETTARLRTDADAAVARPWRHRAGPARLGEQIETAAFALRRGDESLFRLALDTAEAWLLAFYDPERPGVRAAQQEIAALQRIPAHRDLSSLTLALARLRAALGELLVRASTIDADGSG